MFSTGGRARTFYAAVIIAAVVCLNTCTVFAQADSTPLFRIFMLDGAALISYGEFARVAGRVVFSVPMGEGAGLKLQLVSIPDTAVNWERTEDYRAAVRAKRYAETRGEHDFVVLTGQVTQALNDIALAPDPKRRVGMAEEARRNLAAWPAANHGYKAAEVAQLVGMLDDVVAEMRIAAGEKQFDLSLVATAPTPPLPEVLPAPDVRGTLEAAYHAALMAADPSERISLLQVLTQELAFAPSTATWAPGLKTRAAAALAAEMRVEKAYGDLTRQTLEEASRKAARADVRGLQDVIARVLSSDVRLGARRPGEITSLLATLDLRLDEARRLRLARDAWSLRLELLREYKDAVRTPHGRLTRLRPSLTHIRELSGPDVPVLRKVEEYASMAQRELAALTPPAELKTAHDLLMAATHMARQAATLRRTAISSNNLKVAWDAASAASGAILLADQAASEIARVVKKR